MAQSSITIQYIGFPQPTEMRRQLNSILKPIAAGLAFTVLIFFIFKIRTNPTDVRQLTVEGETKEPRATIPRMAGVNTMERVLTRINMVSDHTHRFQGTTEADSTPVWTGELGVCRSYCLPLNIQVNTKLYHV